MRGKTFLEERFFPAPLFKEFVKGDCFFIIMGALDG